MKKFIRYILPAACIGLGTLSVTHSAYSIYNIQQNPALQPATHHTPQVQRFEELEGRYRKLRDYLSWELTSGSNTHTPSTLETLDQLAEMTSLAREHESLLEVNHRDIINYRTTSDEQFKAYFHLILGLGIAIGGLGYAFFVTKEKNKI